MKRSSRAIQTAEVRVVKRMRRECRQCSKPSAVSRAGKLLQMCNSCLDMDAKRKKSR